MMNCRRCYHTLSTLRVLNSLTSAKEPLRLRNPNFLTWYTCGPTVYDAAHLGHARTYVSVDMIHRIITNYFKVPVVHAMGITNVDDKIIQKATDRNVSFMDVANQYEEAFLRDMSRLNVAKPVSFLRVSDHLQSILQFIETLVQHDLAYVNSTGVYFDTTAYGKYGGRLSSASEVDTSEDAVQGGPSSALAKRSVRDFALWKFRDKPSASAGSPVWDSPWGPGRPGWHIECSAMTNSFFGDHLDVHAGGVDLKFPHHENEIAQSEAHLQCCSSVCTQSPTTSVAATSSSSSSSSKGGDGSGGGVNSNSDGHDNSDPASEWCSTFIHTGHLYIQGRKMSKSLKNFITIEDILREYSADEFRMLCALHRYEGSLMYDASGSGGSMVEASTRVRSLTSFFGEARDLVAKWGRSGSLPHGGPSAGFPEPSSSFSTNSTRRAQLNDLFECWGQSQQKLHAALCDNFHTRGAVDAVQDLVSECKHFMSSSTFQVRDVYAVSTIANYAQSVLQDTLGFVSLGFATAASRQPQPSESFHSVETSIDALVEFRSLIRTLAKDSMARKKKLAKGEDPPFDVEKALLSACDHIRDEVLASKLHVMVRDTVAQSDGSESARWTWCTEATNSR
ncbi:mitochondrial cysteinyl-tRNA synthetase (CysRS) [Andalucia godoyi]|uniref:cysteine--tRNA ligase n=1 Tax=Andalucia godoyi TaxID=505711 RepID=A0A8K0F2M2_ANDGO|nr:mitochondrial cysteinyl-tRNA synthetase (CysRS) [Andalucia godoyi]|eukprot:ANDGO_02241.mRNA.1 mitochondrial cysteinyl-tRNA synthetase (CysRS)